MINGEIVVTAPQYVWVWWPTGSAPFYFTGRRYAPDPLYRKPWYSNYFDACFVFCPPVAGAALAYGGPALAAQMVTSRTLGVTSSRFANPYHAGFRGSWNRGDFRIGWSYFERTDMMYFQVRLWNWHVPTVLVTPPPF